MDDRATDTRGPLAVIDVGSNSGRVTVLRAGPGEHLEVLSDGRAPLRLARDLRDRSGFSEETIERTAAALRDFRALADGAGVQRIVAVATAAVRESSNAPALLERIRSVTGLGVTVIDGDLEARYAFLGAVHGLPVQHGLMLDIGGGSMEVTRFRDRRTIGSWTLALGALRTSDAFLASDPPTKEEVEALRDHVARTLRDEGVELLADDERLIATGGTVRNLAKVDRHARSYPIPRLHGYVLTRRRLEDLADLLARRRLARRGSIPGLNADRADSIVGGALVASSTVEHIGAAEIVVSGQGLREGLAFELLEASPRTVEEIRRASVEAMAARFATWDRARAARRALFARRLQEAAEPDAGSGVRERLAHAATLLDVGRSIDYYRRFEHTADLIADGDLAGFTHRKLALLAAVVRQAGNEPSRVQLYRPLLGSDDRVPVARTATLLHLADEIEHRTPPGRENDITCEAEGRTITVRAPIFDPWRRDALAARFRRTLGLRLAIEAD